MRILPVIAAAVLALGIGSSANAAVISYDGSTGMQTTDLQGTPLKVQLFDSRLGELTKVFFTMWGTVSANGSVTNKAAGPESFSVSDSIAFSFSNTGALNSAVSSAGLNTSISQSYSQVATGMSVVFGPHTETTSTLTLTGPLSAFQTDGGGIENILVSTNTNINVSGGGGNAIAQIATVAGASYNVTYEYTATNVPEPISIALLGTGLVGMVAMRRRA